MGRIGVHLLRVERDRFESCIRDEKALRALLGIDASSSTINWHAVIAKSGDDRILTLLRSPNLARALAVPQKDQFDAVHSALSGATPIETYDTYLERKSGTGGVADFHEVVIDNLSTHVFHGRVDSASGAVSREHAESVEHDTLAQLRQFLVDLVAELVRRGYAPASKPGDRKRRRSVAAAATAGVRIGKEDERSPGTDVAGESDARHHKKRRKHGVDDGDGAAPSSSARLPFGSGSASGGGGVFAVVAQPPQSDPTAAGLPAAIDGASSEERASMVARLYVQSVTDGSNDDEELQAQPGDFLVHGGSPIGDNLFPMGKARVFTPEEVRSFFARISMCCNASSGEIVHLLEGMDMSEHKLTTDPLVLRNCMRRLASFVEQCVRWQCGLVIFHTPGH